MNPRKFFVDCLRIIRSEEVLWDLLAQKEESFCQHLPFFFFFVIIITRNYSFYSEDFSFEWVELEKISFETHYEVHVTFSHMPNYSFERTAIYQPIHKHNL